MKLFVRHRDMYYFMGIRVLSRKCMNNGFLYNLFGLMPIAYVHSKLIELKTKFSAHHSLDTRGFDEQIEHEIKHVRVHKIQKQPKSVVILATQLFDMGGHTECIKNIIWSMPDDYKVSLALTNFNASKTSAQNKFAWAAKHTNMVNLCKPGILWWRSLRRTYKQIAELQPSVVLALIHMDDVYGAMLLGMLKASGVKILFYNHASHLPTLGMRFADVILEGTKTTEQITHKQRGYTNTAVVGLPYLPQSQLPRFSNDDIQQMRNKLGIKPGQILTMSGANYYKFFDVKNHASPYFEMIRTLLKRNPNMVHVILTCNVNGDEVTIFENVWKNSPERNRLRIMPTTADYKLLFKCADVFIDSFPVSSALTQIDLISLGVANVIKINRENPMWTFHEYMPENYPFAFDNVPDMINGIEKLMYDEKLRHEIAESNYQFFIDNYEGTKWCKKIIGLADEQ